MGIVEGIIEENQEGCWFVNLMRCLPLGFVFVLKVN